MNDFPRVDQPGFVHRLTGFARTLGMSAMLTMRLFDTYPDREPRDRAAIVRHLSLDEGFDPRELLPNGVVLTLPYTPGQWAEQRGGDEFFQLN
jgi:hypothetical protein